MAPEQSILVRSCVYYEDIICTGNSKDLPLTGKTIGHPGREQLFDICSASWTTGTGRDWSTLSLRSIIADHEIFVFQYQR